MKYYEDGEIQKKNTTGNEINKTIIYPQYKTDTTISLEYEKKMII